MIAISQINDHEDRCPEYQYKFRIIFNKIKASQYINNKICFPDTLYGFLSDNHLVNYNFILRLK